MDGEYRSRSHHGLVLVAMGRPIAEENYALVFDYVEPRRVLELAGEFFGEQGYSIVVESGTDDALVDFLESDGWSIDEDVPSMLLRPIPDPVPRSSPLEIRPVTTEEEYAAYLHVSDTSSRWVPSLAAATDPDVCLLVGYIDDEPVATSRISCLGNLGEINGVVTDPRFRRRGFGTAMTWAIIAEGVKRGCDAIVLTATELGYPVYRRMGFVPVCSYRTYLPPETGVNTTSANPARAPRGS